MVIRKRLKRNKVLENMIKEDDKRWMKRALFLAAKARGRTSPNPMVGAVIVKDGILVSEGYHEKAGNDHAEIVAIRRAGQKAKGSTLYINLEPCIHYGKTPPCVPAIIEAGIKSVVIGVEDPNPLVKGEGIRKLKEAGLDVQVGVLEKESKKLNEAFFKYIIKKEPFVILKVASTLDGKIATKDGESKWITGERARMLVHHFRDQVDAVLVGIETILRDNPFLTTRIKGGKDPLKVILDSRLRIPEDANVININPEKTIIAVTELAPKERQARIKEKGVKILLVESKNGMVNLKHLLLELGKMEIMTLMVEGGSRVNGSFFDEGLIDKIIIFFSPKLIGNSQPFEIFNGIGINSLKEAKTLKELKFRRIGEDIYIEGYF